MSKIFSVILFLFACSLSFAKTSVTGITSKKNNKYAVQELITFDELQVDSINNNLSISKNIASELPDAVLRLHDLKKVKFRGEIIYTRSPLELSTLKSHIKTA